jgi:predicted ATPase/class 3 adenylate cyclase
VLPSGRVTVLFSDIEGSTSLVRSLGERYDELLTEHFAIVRRVLDAHDGVEVRTEGDAVFAVFADAAAALKAATEAQRQLQAHAWPADGRIKVRMGLHTGDVRVRAGDYVGLAVHQAARIVTVAHGEQILCSSATADSARGSLASGVQLVELGAFQVRDFDGPERVFQVTAAGLVDEFPAIRAFPEDAHNLPSVRTAFIGRESELTDVAKRVEEEQIVTLTGPGGVGKTRVAFEIARRVAQQRRDGATAVLLATIDDPDLVILQTAETLGVREEPGQPLLHTLCAALERRDALIVLDNCEHVLVPVAEMVDAIVNRAQDIGILATSRAPLSVAGEVVYPLRPFEVPDDGPSSAESALELESVRLFVDRARAVDTSFEFNDELAPIVRRICRSVDGLPLAIELAAGRLRSMTVVDMEHRLGQRLRVLAADTRGVDARQRSLRATIDWSFNMLSPDEQAVMARLSIFPAGATLAATEAVCPDEEVLEVVHSLVDRSLVQLSDEGTGRYTLLQTVREYALERLESRHDRRQTLEAFARWALQITSDELDRSSGVDARGALERLETEHPNLLAALERMLTERLEPELAAELGVALGRYWDVAGYWTNAAEYLDRIPDAGSASVRARLAYRRGGFAQLRGDLDAARRLFEDAMVLAREAGDHETEAIAHLSQGAVHQTGADRNAAVSEYQQARAAAALSGDESLIAHVACQTTLVEVSTNAVDELDRIGEAALNTGRRLGNIRLQAEALMVLGLCVSEPEEFASAIERFESALDAATMLGSSGLRARALFALASYHRLLGELDTARARCEEALGVAERLGNRQLQAVVRAKLGNIAWAGQRYEDATASYLEVLPLVREIGDRQLEIKTLSDLGWTSGSAGDIDRAAAYVDEGLAVARAAQWPENEVWFMQALGILAAARGDLSTARTRYEEGLERLRAVDLLGHEVPFVQGLAVVAQAEQAFSTARNHLAAAIDLSRSYGQDDAEQIAVARSGLVELDLGNEAEATRLILDALRGAQPRGALLRAGTAREGLGLLLPALWVAAATKMTSEPSEAARMTGAASRIERCGDEGGPIWSMSAADRERTVRATSAVRERLDEETFAECWDAGYGDPDVFALVLQALEGVAPT